MMKHKLQFDAIVSAFFLVVLVGCDGGSPIVSDTKKDQVKRRAASTSGTPSATLLESDMASVRKLYRSGEHQKAIALAKEMLTDGRTTQLAVEQLSRVYFTRTEIDSARQLVLTHRAKVGYSDFAVFIDAVATQKSGNALSSVQRGDLRDLLIRAYYTLLHRDGVPGELPDLDLIAEVAVSLAVRELQSGIADGDSVVDKQIYLDSLCEIIKMKPRLTGVASAVLANHKWNVLNNIGGDVMEPRPKQPSESLVVQAKQAISLSQTESEFRGLVSSLVNQVAYPDNVTPPDTSMSNVKIETKGAMSNEEARIEMEKSKKRNRERIAARQARIAEVENARKRISERFNRYREQ